MSLTSVGSLSLTEAITLRALTVSLTVDHAIVVYSRGTMAVEYLIEMLHIRFCHCEGGARAELQWNKTIRVIHHVSTFLGFTRDKINDSPSSSPPNCSRSEKH